MNTFTNRNGQPISSAAYHALNAAYHVKQWGLYMALEYTMKRASISYREAIRLVTLARQLIAMDKLDALQDTQAANLPAFLRKQAF